MPSYRVYALKDSLRQQFRAAPHVSGSAAVKPKDYDPRGQIDALHEYDAWRLLRESGEPLAVGDLSINKCEASPPKRCHAKDQFTSLTACSSGLIQFGPNG